MEVTGLSVPVPPLHRYRKRPMVVHAARMDTDFECLTIDGNRARGLAGDYLVRDVEGYFYPCAARVFEQTYEAAHERGSD